MAAVLELVKLFSRKRKAEDEFLSRQYIINEEMAKKRFLRGMELETEASEPAVMLAIVIRHKKQQKRARSRGTETGGRTDTKTGMEPLSRKG